MAQAFNTGSDHDLRSIALAAYLVRFFEFLSESGRFLRQDAKVELPELGRKMCLLYAAQSHEAVENKKQAWKLVPKFHMFEHFCEEQGPKMGNPRFFWIYADEDLVGLIIEVAQSCHPSTWAVTALFKYFLLRDVNM